jgi:hypothetical protein
MSNTGRFIENFKKHNFRGFEVGGDAGGLGIVMLDCLAEKGYHVKRIYNNSPAQRSESFSDLAAESWATVAQLIERKLIRLPPDERLVAQLTSRQRRYTSGGFWRRKCRSFRFVLSLELGH